MSMWYSCACQSQPKQICLMTSGNLTCKVFAVTTFWNTQANPAQKTGWKWWSQLVKKKPGRQASYTWASYQRSCKPLVIFLWPVVSRWAQTSESFNFHPAAWNSPWARSEQGTLHPNAVVQMRPQKPRTKLPPLRRCSSSVRMPRSAAEVMCWFESLLVDTACSQSTSGL